MDVVVHYYYNFRRDIMATQIASTPVIKGKEAVKIYKEAHKRPSDKAKLNAVKLAESYGKIFK